jgi:FkbM family methyltransferase
MLKKLITTLLDATGDLLATSSLARRSINRIAERMNGLIFDSYSIEEEAALALSFLSGGVMVDGGANQGEYSQGLLDFGKDRIKKLLLFEPNPFHEPKLKALVAAAGSGQVLFESTALGSEAGRMVLHFDRDGSGLASLYQRDLTHHGLAFDQQVEVTVDTLDHLTRKHGLDVIDFLKLDLEGHELEALRGAERMLGENAIRAIAFEFGGTNVDSRVFLRDFWNLLGGKYGFTFYRILPRRRLLQLERNDERDERFSWQNLLACAPGVHPSWRIIPGRPTPFSTSGELVSRDSLQ